MTTSFLRPWTKNITRTSSLVIASIAACLTARADFGPDLGLESVDFSGLSTPLRSAPRTYEAYYAAPAFASLAQPTTIYGIQFRLAIGENWRPAGYVGSAWPDAPINFSSFSITLAKASTELDSDGQFPSLTPTFASYMVDPVVVRSGALSFSVNSFQADGGATGIHSWGPTISFNTPYTLNPGESLVMLINHEGYGAAATPLQAFFASHDFQNGLADAISSTSSGTATNPSSFSSPLFVNFVTIPEPSSCVLVLLGGATCFAQRRLRKSST